MVQVENQLRILQVLERDPETTQASLATQISMSVGSVNGHLRGLIREGYVKPIQMERRRLKYLVTPEGVALKERLAAEYLEASLGVYRELRGGAAELLAAIKAAEYEALAVAGDGAAIDILRLTCLEWGIPVVRADAAETPTVRTRGVGYAVDWPSGGGAD